MVGFYRLYTIRLFAASPPSSVIVNWVGRTVLVGTIAGRPHSTEMAEEEAGGRGRDLRDCRRDRHGPNNDGTDEERIPEVDRGARPLTNLALSERARFQR